MTNAQYISAYFYILAALLFVGSSVSSEVERSFLSGVLLNQPEDAEAQQMSRKPCLQPKENPPVIETYTWKKDGQVCVMARLGVQFIVKENQTLYFNMDPKSTKATGYCSDQKTVLSLVFDGGSVGFVFIKKNDKSYVHMLRTLLEPSCNQCKDKSYPGILDHGKLFQTSKGMSFKCQSNILLKMAENLSIKIISLQIQGFDLHNGTFGTETECWDDYNKRIVPTVVGAVVAGIILTAILVFVLMRERRHQGYDRL